MKLPRMVSISSVAKSGDGKIVVTGTAEGAPVEVQFPATTSLVDLLLFLQEISSDEDDEDIVVNLP